MKPISQLSTEQPPSRRSKVSKKWLVYGGLGLLSLVIVFTLGPVISHPIERVISIVENRYQQWFDQQDTANPKTVINSGLINRTQQILLCCYLWRLSVGYLLVYPPVSWHFYQSTSVTSAH